MSSFLLSATPLFFSVSLKFFDKFA
uniref:Uncharacterized protein n=1 Tax=Arundo donax TaxID=35708 RepID=A0A0A8YA70_ARUDO